MNEANKSVLVIDTPSSCRECKLKCDKYKESKLCAATKIYVDSYYDDNSKPDWCPLTPLPPHKDLMQYIQRGDVKSTINMIHYMYGEGWNTCREEILKGEK